MCWMKSGDETNTSHNYYVTDGLVGEVGAKFIDSLLTRVCLP